MGYPENLLISRSIIKHGKFALITPEGLVNNNIPGFVNCDISILSTPKLGASFVDYLVTMHKGGKNIEGFGQKDSTETFVYVLDGRVKVSTGNEAVALEEGGYLYCPPSEKMYLENIADHESKIFLYKQEYQPLEGYEPWMVYGNAKEIPGDIYADMDNVHLKDLLPGDLAFDMNFHILSFKPGGSHPFIETHVQEHGAYILSGEGMYNLDNQWIPVKKGDYIFMGPYVPQATYAVGRESFSYVYSKDCNRDPEL